jgi:hypothetical protein
MELVWHQVNLIEVEKSGLTLLFCLQFRPSFVMKAYPIDAYPAKCRQAAAIQLMIMNNLDNRVCVWDS